MRILPIAVAVGAASLAHGSGIPDSYGEARSNWESHKDSGSYQTYLSEFVQFNNHFHLDTRGGCYALGPGTVEMMLVITHATGDQYARIEDVLTDADSPKARCFVNSYKGVKTKVPPYLPFVLQLTMQ